MSEFHIISDDEYLDQPGITLHEELDGDLIALGGGEDLCLGSGGGIESPSRMFNQYQRSQFFQSLYHDKYNQPQQQQQQQGSADPYGR